jgi:IPT/TIG domain
MKLSLMTMLLVAASFAAWGQPAMPRMVSVEPLNGKVGDVLVVTGENLQKAVVAKVYLTNGNTDPKDPLGMIDVVITEQSETAIKFKIPAKATGRLALMVLTAGKDAKLIEQPVKVSIDE